MKRLLFVIFCIVCISSVQAADRISKTQYLYDKKIPTFIDIVQDEERTVEDFDKTSSKNYLKSLLKYNDETTAVPIKKYKDKIGGYHESFVEYYRGVEVEGTKYTIHYGKDGNVYKASGCFWTIDQLNTIPKISEGNALQYAIRHIGAKKYAWEDSDSERMIKHLKNDPNATNYPKGILLIHIKDNLPYLAYKFIIDAISPDLHYCIYVDAHSGKVIDKFDTVCGASASVNTVYSGTRTIQTDYNSSQYRLRDYTRGSGIETYKATGINSGVDYTSSNNTWSNMTTLDRNAFDVHWGSEMTYDFYYNKFGRNSYDDNGAKIVSYVNDVTYNMAAWWGSYHIIQYGFRDTVNLAQPYISLDIVAHEITHAVTQETSGLLYSGEPGAVNEFLSDVFGACVMHEYRPEFSDYWKHGVEIYGVNDCRDLSNPSCKFFHGNNWYATNDSYDNGGVHRNSGVGSYWFYLLVNGGAGYNESGMNRPVTGIGMDKAMRICYLVNTEMLTLTTAYRFFAFSSCEAARQLGYSDSVIEQITNAWFDVGVFNLSDVLTINGPNTIYGSASYYVEDLPSGLNVTWHLSDSYFNNSNYIHQNSPFTNYCTIDASTCRDMTDATLTALFRNGNDSIYGFVDKTISAPKTGMEGTYTNGLTTKPINLPNPLYVLPNIIVTITSPCLKGTTVTYSGDFTPTNWLHNSSQGTLKVGVPLSGTLVVQIACNSGATHNLPIIVTNNPYLLSVILSEDQMKISIISELEEGKEESTQKINDGDFVWTLEIYNATTGEKVIRQKVVGEDVEICTTDWKPGIYIIRAIIGENVLTEKVVIK